MRCRRAPRRSSGVRSRSSETRSASESSDCLARRGPARPTTLETRGSQHAIPTVERADGAGRSGVGLLNACATNHRQGVVDGKTGLDVECWRRCADELGVAGIAVPEEQGGAGGSLLDAAVVMEAAGAAVSTLPFVDLDRGRPDPRRLLLRTGTATAVAPRWRPARSYPPGLGSAAQVVAARRRERRSTFSMAVRPTWSPGHG